MVHTCITSPPYYGLRDYKTEPVIWDGDENCEHDFEKIKTKRDNASGGKNSKKQNSNRGSHYADYESRVTTSSFCKKCNAWKGQLGQEPTPELYVKHLVDIFREVKRVLRDDGILWLNLGDSYWGSGGSTGHTPESKNLGKFTFVYGAYPSAVHSQKKHSIFKPKDLLMIPARAAIALQEDGWYIRRDVIWDKPNPMPESVTDRPTTSHEYIFMLTKKKNYYYDYAAVREKSESNVSDIKKMIEQRDRIGGKTLSADDSKYKANMNTNIGNNRGVGDPFGRNKRSVWKVSTSPFTEAHFAVFPPDLIAPMVLASTSEAGCCEACGKPYKRIVEKISLSDLVKDKLDKKRAESATKYDKKKDSAGRLATYRQTGRKTAKQIIDSNNDDSGLFGYNSKYFTEHGQEVQGMIRSGSQVKERQASRLIAAELFPDDFDAQQKFINHVHDHGEAKIIITKGWKKNCACKTENTIPAVVFDPFFGSGTTGLVAAKAGRDYLGIELQENYKEIQKARLGIYYKQLKLI